MPKLNPQLSTQVKEAAESGGFNALDAGPYRVRLTKVEAKTAQSSGNPMWVWEFEVLGLPDGTPKYKGRKLWNNTVLTDAAFWAVGESFAAFGVETDTDTDELIGCTVVLTVSQRVIPTGTRAGQTGNNVDSVGPDKSASAIRHPNSTLEGGGKVPVGAGSVPVSSEDVADRF